MSFLEKYADRMVKFRPDTIEHYLADGVEKVCDIRSAPGVTWHYHNMNTELMFADHTSWVYFIVVDGIIYKVGETGVPLGIKNRDGQPYKGTKCRLGRYASHKEINGTDYVIRCDLLADVRAGKVSIWALKCPIVQTPISLGGSKEYAHTTIHKDLELKYLDYMLSYGHWPAGNKSRK